jgi:hypothetical protein
MRAVSNWTAPLILRCAVRAAPRRACEATAKISHHWCSVGIQGSFTTRGTRPRCWPPHFRPGVYRPCPTGFDSQTPSSTKKSKNNRTCTSRC